VTDFEPGLIEKLQAEWPEVDVAALSNDMGGALYPEALLRSKVRKEAARLAAASHPVGNLSSRPREPDPAREIWLAEIQHKEQGYFEKGPCPPERVRVYVQLMKWLWSGSQAPTAKQTAAWLRQNGQALLDLEVLVERLEAWPEGQPYPPLPDERTLLMIRAADAPYNEMEPWERSKRREELAGRLWLPGSKAGTVIDSTAILKNQPPEANQ